MPVTGVVKDAPARTLTVTARFDAPIGGLWQVWSDPRQLERWWGPPSYPATVSEHDPAPGATINYFLTGPDGKRHGGWFYMRAADPPHMLELDAGFADADGNPLADGHTAVIRVDLRDLGGDATQMTITTTWPSDEAMEHALALGMQVGMTAAVGQIDTLLDPAAQTPREER